MNEVAYGYGPCGGGGGRSFVKQEVEMKVASVLLGFAASLLLATVVPAAAQYSSAAGGRATTFTQPETPRDPDYANAKPLPIPAPTSKPTNGVEHAAPSPLPGKPGMVPGGQGDGKQAPERLAPEINVQASPEDAGPVCGIECQFPFTTNRAQSFGVNTVNFYPFRAAGKLFFTIGTASFVCSASLIAPGLVVTAAHCVANFGQQQFYSNWVYVPAYINGLAPYGRWRAQSVTILSSYFNGTDPCFQSGVICQDDVAVILLRPQLSLTGLTVPGFNTGWFGFGWNGYGFFGETGNTQITQLGYPCNLDTCQRMERTDSFGFRDSLFSNNTIIGSEQEGGSSGGPWLVNFGQPPLGLQATDLLRNIVVGVTSWGFVNPQIMEQGAAPFLSSNILTLHNAVCPHKPQC
jgi:V8-like Glu-specific endopeptidase